jgi:tetratricopeptide (TPR) repeat protein
MMKINYRAFFVICTFIVVLSGCASSRAFRRADEGRDLLNTKDYDGAIEKYSEAIRLVGYPFWIWCVNRGEAYEKKGEFDMAIADYTKAIEDYGDPGLTSAILKRGHVYEKKGDFELATADYKEVSKLVSAMKSRDQFDLEYLADASDSLKRVYALAALAKVPGPAKEAASRGLAAYNSKNYALAITEYTEAVKIYPDFFPPVYGLALIYHDTGQYDHAITWFNKALGIEPGNAEAKDKLAAARSMKNAEAYIAQGKSYEDKKDYANAIAAYRRAAAAYPDHTAAKQYLTAAFEKRIAENKTVYPSPFEGEWKCLISPASSYTETVRGAPREVPRTSYRTEEGGYMGPNGWVRTTRQVPMTYYITEYGPDTIRVVNVPEASVSYKFRGRTYQKFLGRTTLVSSGMFYYEGDRIELEDGETLHFRNNEILAGKLNDKDIVCVKQ